MDADNFNETLFTKLTESELFKTYQSAFRCATGLPLRLVGPDTSVTDLLCLSDENSASFCEKINLCKSACAACIEVNERLMKEAGINGPTTCHCFTGMASTAIPIRNGPALIGFLRTGQVFHKLPDAKRFDSVAKALTRQGLKSKEIEKLRATYNQTRIVEPERYNSMVTLLVTFGQQLNRHVEKLALISEGSEPAAVAKAREFIDSALADPLPLSLVARHAGLSESHFCRVFKESTGLTLTDYVNRRRIEWAKKELLKPEVRISEIAFQIGYQSLSQFNRSFARFTGSSPTHFRREQLETVGTVQGNRNPSPKSRSNRPARPAMRN